MKRHVVTVIPGDGIGPEVVHATQRVIEAAGVKIDWEQASAGASVFLQGIPSGVPQATIDSIRRTRVALKGPLETPVGYGEKSANVTLRKLFETYGNIRPAREIPGVRTPYSGRGIDLTIVRENVEDLYAGIEHMQTPDVAQCLKLISRKGCEKIVRLAFEVARAEGKKTVHCATKSNIMKLTEGMLKRVFEEVSKDYSDIESQHIIVDNCAHQLVKKPEQFGVIVTTNMNGDILSDLTSALIGGLGFAPSANIGSDVAIFEAVHGSAPKYAGKDVINPTAMILSGALMLRHLGEIEAAARIELAVDRVWESGKAPTRDVVGDLGAAGTRAYTEALIGELQKISPRESSASEKSSLKPPQFASNLGLTHPRKRAWVGVDVFIEAIGEITPFAKSLEEMVVDLPLRLKMISNRGTQVYPANGGSPDLIAHQRCRFVRRSDSDGDVDPAALATLLKRISDRWSWMHIEKLQSFDGAPGYTKAQGED